jgi:serine/threonine protein kinase
MFVYRRNVLVQQVSPHELVCKIADFGLARQPTYHGLCSSSLFTNRMRDATYSADAYEQHSRQAVPWKWLSIEALMTQSFSSKSDVWAFGVTMWEILTYGTSPYIGGMCAASVVTSLAFIVASSAVETRDILSELLKGERLTQPDGCPEDLYAIMQSTWAHFPEDRPVSTAHT